MTGEKIDKSDTSIARELFISIRRAIPKHVAPWTRQRQGPRPHVHDRGHAGVTFARGTCFEWEIQSSPEKRGIHEVMGEGEAPPRPRRVRLEGLPSDAWIPCTLKIRSFA